MYVKSKQARRKIGLVSSTDYILLTNNYFVSIRFLFGQVVRHFSFSAKVLVRVLALICLLGAAEGT